MNKNFFEEIYKNAGVSIIICKFEEKLPVIFMNERVKSLLPLSINSSNTKDNFLKNILHLEDEALHDVLIDSLIESKNIKVNALIHNSNEQLIETLITANLINIDDEDFAIFYIVDYNSFTLFKESEDDIMSKIYNEIYSSDDVEKSLLKLLEIAGSHIEASRAYIFENSPSSTVSNTYEWCHFGIVPWIERLQNVSLSEFMFDFSLETTGIYVINDSRNLILNDKDFLESQDIKSIIMLPIKNNDKIIASIGFDDCEKYRIWTNRDIQFIRNIAGTATSLIDRRNAEREAKRSNAILQKTLDTSDSIIYVNDIKTYQIKFASKSLLMMLNQREEDILGKECWKILQANQIGPCSFCPMKKIINEDGPYLNGFFTWEFQNTINNHWYLVKDSIIKWVDGSLVHIETSTDITNRKNYEETLSYIASVDKMTKTNNREWGYKKLEAAYNETLSNNLTYSLCFIDLDGLKIINDTYGHSAGDDMIKETVRFIRSGITREDILCRWGGDEFILLIKKEPSFALKILENITHDINIFNKENYPLKKFNLSFSYGISEFKFAKDVPIDYLITNADKEMYTHKKAKKKKHNNK